MNAVMRAVVVFSVLIGALCAQEPSENSDDRLKRLEEQNRAILQRLEQTEARLRNAESRNRDLEANVDRLETDRKVDTGSDALSVELNRLTGRVENGLTFKDLTRSGKAIKFYGFFRLDNEYSTARVDNIDATFLVQPETGDLTTGAFANDDTFAMSAKMTRLGIILAPDQLGCGNIGAKLEMDFHSFIPDSTATVGVVADSRTPIRLRLAYLEGNFGEVGFRAGQDWDVISPLNPSVDIETSLWNAGNTGDRRPQAEFWWNHGNPDCVQFNLKLSAGLTGAVNGLDNDGALPAGERDGFDSGRPNLQARTGLTFGSWVHGKQASVGAWGLIGSLETDKPVGLKGDKHFQEWIVGGDWTVPIVKNLAWRGEAWFGQALGDERGNIGQVFNTTTGETIHGWGGWTELTFQASDKWLFSVGATIDNPDDANLNGSTAALELTQGRKKNWTTYTGIVYDWGKGLKTGLDVIYWETQYLGLGVGNTVRGDLWIQLEF